MPIYHYHATKQMNGQATMQIDGIAELEKPILTMDDYISLKNLIASDAEIGGRCGLTICSLTLLRE